MALNKFKDEPFVTVFTWVMLIMFCLFLLNLMLHGLVSLFPSTASFMPKLG